MRHAPLFMPQFTKNMLDFSTPYISDGTADGTRELTHAKTERFQSLTELENNGVGVTRFLDMFKLAQELFLAAFQQIHFRFHG